MTNPDDPSSDNVRSPLGRSENALLLGTALITALVLTLVYTWPSFHAQFGLIGDHEPLTWMGRDGRLGVGEFWSTWYSKTEVGQWGGDGRYRPSY